MRMSSAVVMMIGGVALMVVGCYDLTQKQIDDQQNQLNKIAKDNKNFINQLRETRSLRQLFSKEAQIKQSSWQACGFFNRVFDDGNFLAGGNSNTGESIRVRFCWNLDDETYIFTEMPMDKIRIKIVEDIAPTVTFNIPWRNYFGWEGAGLFQYYKDKLWYDCSCYMMEQQFNENPTQFLNKNADFATITCREEDWPALIEMPGLGRK